MKVFVCHASRDKRFVRRLVADLESYGLDVWLDENEIAVGQSLHDAIEKGLRSSDFIVIVLSSVSLSRPWVKRELHAALTLELSKRKRLILPVIKEPTRLPLFLADTKYADFSKGYRRGLDELIVAFQDRRPSLGQQLETQACRITLDLLRRDGSLLRYTKTQIVVAKTSGVERYVEAMSADGQLSTFRVRPGSVVGTRMESGLTYVTTAFPTPLEKGDRATREFSCLFVNSFTGDEEYWDQRQYHASRNVSIVIRFMKSRPPLEWHAFEKKGPDLFNIDKKLERRRYRGRVILKLDLPRTRLLSSYVVRWRW